MTVLQGVIEYDWEYKATEGKSQELGSLYTPACQELSQLDSELLRGI